MLRLFRVTKQKYVEAGTALQGSGRAGRWAPEGVRMLYATDAVASALLETLVYAQQADLLAAGVYAVLELVVPPALVQTLDATRLPPNWNAPWHDRPAPLRTQQIGRAWAEGHVSPVLAVPSAVLPGWHVNYLLNPAHAAFGEIAVLPAEPLAFDPRLSARLTDTG